MLSPNPSDLENLTAASTRAQLAMLTDRWQTKGLDAPYQVGPGSLEWLIEGLHSCNLFSWHADDKSRAAQPDGVLMQHKRDLDASNLMRSRFMEAIDLTVADVLQLRPRQDLGSLYVNSETVGQIIDRLSVMTLKHHFLSRRLNGLEVSETLQRVDDQLFYVSYCMDKFLKALLQGKAQMLAYRQFKTYQPPES